VTDPLRADLARALAGEFQVQRELGGGGMSRVFLAQDLSLGRPVVIKVLAGERGVAVDAERFRREVLLSARLQHPHIVPVLRAGDVEGRSYFVMPFVEGASLRALLRTADQPFSVAEAVRYLRNVAAALAYAHERGVVHRDIKPDNVMVSGGVAVVLDFGVAKAVAASSAPEDANVTSAGMAIGTPAYMAPEQAAGDPQVDQRADLYAFGILAYELFTGSTPFGGRDPHQVLRAHLVDPPTPVLNRRGDLPPDLAALVMRCLAKAPRERPQSAKEILDQLDALGTPSRGIRSVTPDASSRAVAVTVPLALYAIGAAGLLLGLWQLAGRGALHPRVPTFALIGAVLGLPLVTAAGVFRSLRDGLVGLGARTVAGAVIAIGLVGGGVALTLQPAAAGELRTGSGPASSAAQDEYARAVTALEGADTARAVVLLESATARDSTFAEAWRRLAAILVDRPADSARAAGAYGAAYRHLSRLGDRERYVALAGYYTHVRGEPDRALAAWLTLLDLAPDDPEARAAVAAARGGRP
jgi:serine/threonine-protein kinase